MAGLIVVVLLVFVVGGALLVVGGYFWWQALKKATEGKATPSGPFVPPQDLGRKCMTCGGTGRQYGDQACSACAGSGRTR